MDYKTIRVALLGDRKVGKSALIQRHKTGEFLCRYTPTAGFKTTKLPFYTQVGLFVIEIVEATGDEMPDNVAAGLIMFDCMNRLSYENAPSYYLAFRKKNAVAPVVLLGSKSDFGNLAVPARDIHHHVSWCVPVYQISSKSNYNFEKPFISIIRSIMRNKGIRFTEVPYYQQAALTATIRAATKPAFERCARCNSDAQKRCGDCDEWLCGEHILPHAEVDECAVCQQDICRYWFSAVCTGCM